MAGDYDPYAGPLPGAGAFQQYQATAEGAYQAAISQVKNQRDAYLGSNGLTAVNGGTGDDPYTSFSVNANDPTGAFQQMSAGNAGGAAADQAAIGSFGFHGGLANQAKENSQAGYSANAKAWADAVSGKIAGYGQDDVTASTTRSNNESADLLGTINAAIQAGTFNPADYSGLTIPGADGTLTDVGKIIAGSGLTGSASGGPTVGSGPPGGGGGGTGGGSGNSSNYGRQGNAGAQNIHNRIGVKTSKFGAWVPSGNKGQFVWKPYQGKKG